MKPNEIEAMIAVGRIGLNLAASRMMSISSIFGVVALAAYLIYSPSWQGVLVVGFVAVVAITALRLESRGKNDVAGGSDE